MSLVGGITEVTSLVAEYPPRVFLAHFIGNAGQLLLFDRDKPDDDADSFPDFNIVRAKFLFGLLNCIEVRFARKYHGLPHNVITFTFDDEAVNRAQSRRSRKKKRSFGPIKEKPQQGAGGLQSWGF